MLDHESSNPYYRQIADYFAAQIRDEVLKPGRKLPSESELCSQFSVSRVTARKAIRELEALGLVYSRQGKGTYVQPRPLEEKPRNNPSFTSVVKEHGMSMTSKLLQASIMQATEHERQQFQLPPDSKIVYIKRLRFVEGNPFLIEMSWYSERFVGLLVHDLEKESVYEILRQEYNVLTLNAKKSIELASITSEEAELLQTSKRQSQVLLLRECVTDETGAFVHYTKELIVGTYRLELQ